MVDTFPGKLANGCQVSPRFTVGDHAGPFEWITAVTTIY